jgi:hypothetical protein
MTTRRCRQRPVFVLHLRPEPDIDAVKALRALLKLSLRKFGMRCTSIAESNFATGPLARGPAASSDRSATTIGDGGMKMSKFVKKFLKITDVAEGPLLRHIAGTQEGNYGPELVFASGEICSLNMTNNITLINAWGDDSDAWLGKEVELSEGETEIMARDEKGDLLRDADGNPTGEKKMVPVMLIRPISSPLTAAEKLAPVAEAAAVVAKIGRDAAKANGRNSDMDDDIPF